MTSDRPCRKSLSVEEAATQPRVNAATQFDPELVAALLTAIQDTDFALD